MKTRREFLVHCAASGLMLTAGGVFAEGAALSPPDMVRAYLAARARHDSAGQYALFSAEAQSSVPFAQFDTAFAGATPLSHAAEDGVSPLLACVTVFFMDAQGKAGYQFSVLGPDPADPAVVFVQARPPGVTSDKAFLLKIETVPGTAGAARLDITPSYQKTSAHDTAIMRKLGDGLGSLSNLRQIGLAMIMYAQAHGDHLPDADHWADALLAGWAAYDKSFPAERLFRDRSAPESQQWNYAFNLTLSGVKMADIRNPGATVLVFESTAGVKNAADTGQSLPHPGRHAGGDYYVFADGHAKWFPDGTKLSFKLTGN